MSASSPFPDLEVAGLNAPLIELFRVGVALDRALDDPALVPGAASGIGLSGALTLVLIDVAGPLRPGMIVKMTSLTSAGVSQLLERLEADGLVTRSLGAVPQDRRAVIVTINEVGRAALATVDRIVAKASGDLVHALEVARAAVTETPESVAALAPELPSPAGSCPVLASLLNLTVLIDASIARVVADSTALPPTEARPHLLLQETVRRGELPVGEIPHLIGQARGAAGRLLARLEADGLLRRERAVAAGRTVVVVRPTDRGTSVATAIQSRLAADFPGMTPAIDQFLASVRARATP